MKAVKRCSGFLAIDMVARRGGGGGSQDFKWQRSCINVGLKQSPIKSLDQNLTPKKSHAEFQRHKNFSFLYSWNQAAERTRELLRIFRLFWIPKNISLLKSSYLRKILAKIFLPKKISKSKLSKTEKSFDHPCHFKSGVTPLGLWPYDIAVNSAVKHSFSLALCAFSIALNNYLCY